ncbi:jg13868 [Pararge aegeria aegeria]|uniref:Jg13868 protein n=1 Tax=Pararge aegeria aegeria TaxID=348720 RepID=A0A8S4S661_9NEOP|nr:jg13868 [Pararge aegeria aegeria]
MKTIFQFPPMIRFTPFNALRIPQHFQYLLASYHLYRRTSIKTTPLHIDNITLETSSEAAENTTGGLFKMGGIHADIIHPFVVKTSKRLIGNMADKPLFTIRLGCKIMGIV